MNDYINVMIGIVGPVMILSLLSMGSYLVRRKIYTAWELRKNILWPTIAFSYRDYTRKHFGKVGILYYVFCISGVVTTLAILLQAITIAYKASKPILFTVILTGCVILPIIGYWIYTMWKERYF